MDKQVALIAGVLLGLAATARADVPPFPIRPGKTALRSAEAPLVVAAGAKDDPQMYVRLPRNLWQQLRAEASRDGDSLRSAAGPSRASTLLAGAALTLATSLGGLWLVRGRSRRVIGGAALALVGAVLIGASGCPWTWPDNIINTCDEPLTPPVAQADGSLKGEALLQIADNRPSVEVVVPRTEWEGFVQKAASPKP